MPDELAQLALHERLDAIKASIEALHADLKAIAAAEGIDLPSAKDFW